MKSFLLVDDDDKILTMNELFINHRFGDSNILISKAYNGLEALEKTRELDYTVILSDIEMPEMNGIEFHQRLKAENPALAERMAFISGNLDGSNSTYLRKEQRPCLEKPFSTTDYFELIDTILTVEKHKFTTEHGYHCKRKHARFNSGGACTFESLRGAQAEVKSIVGDITDYSEGGLGVALREASLLPVPGLIFHVSSESHGITGREGKVVWSTQQNGDSRAGLQWV